MLHTRKRTGCTLCEECTPGLQEIVLADRNCWGRAIEFVLHDKVRNNIRPYWCKVGDYVASRDRLHVGFLPITQIQGNFWPKTADILSMTENLVVGKPLVISIIDISTKKVRDRIVSVHPVAHILMKFNSCI